MKFLITISFILIHFFSFSQNKINWMTIQEAEQKCKTQPKKIFIDIYTDWCGWCKKMDKSTFLDSNIVKYMNENYYAVKFNAEIKDSILFKGQKYGNSKPTEKRGVNWLAIALLDGQMSYPSYVVLDENLNRIGVIKGYLQVTPTLTYLNFFGMNLYQQYANFLFNEFKKEESTTENK